MEDNDDFPVRNKTIFVTPKVREALINNSLQSTMDIPLKPAKHLATRRNLNSTEQTSILSLENDNNIITKTVDKGGATVIMDKQHYQKQMEKISSNTDYYDSNLHRDIMKKV